MNRVDELIKQVELQKEAEVLIKKMFDGGMTVDEIQDELCDIANKIDFKRFQEEQRHEQYYDYEKER